MFIGYTNHMINAISTALSGLTASTRKVDVAATNIANAGTPGNQVDLAEEAVNLKVAEQAYKANLLVVETASKMTDELLSTFDERV